MIFGFAIKNPAKIDLTPVSPGATHPVTNILLLRSISSAAARILRCRTVCRECNEWHKEKFFENKHCNAVNKMEESLN